MRMFSCRHMRELEEELQQRGKLAGAATVFTHQLELLLRLTNALDRNAASDSIQLVNRWVPAWRYTADLSNRGDAEDFLEAVEDVSHWIDTNI